MKKLLTTERTYLREMTEADYDDLCEILQDPQAMYAYEHAFDDAEAHAWLDRQLERYRVYGFGLWAVIHRQTGAFLGQAGLSMQDVEGTQELEIGYLFKRRYWRNGYATEVASALRTYVFDTLGKDRVVCTIRDNNLASRRVAERLGMQVEKVFVKHYYGMDMPHLLYVSQKEEAQ